MSYAWASLRCLLPITFRAAESAKQRTGTAVAPVFVSLDPVHDTSDSLKIASGRSGMPGGITVLTGPPNELLSCAERFKNKMAAAAEGKIKGDESMKKVGEVAGTTGFVSDHGERAAMCCGGVGWR